MGGCRYDGNAGVAWPGLMMWGSDGGGYGGGFEGMLKSSSAG